jgi:hypothetical protein
MRGLTIVSHQQILLQPSNKERTGYTGHVAGMGDLRNAYKIMVSFLRKIPLGRPRLK